MMRLIDLLLIDKIQNYSKNCSQAHQHEIVCIYILMVRVMLFLFLFVPEFLIYKKFILIEIK